MPFGVVSGIGLDMGVIDFGGDRRRQRGSLGVNLHRPIVTKGDFVASLCGIAYSDRAVVWRGKVGPGIHVLDGSTRASWGRDCFWHGFWHISKIRLHRFQWRHGVPIIIIIIIVERKQAYKASIST